MYLAIINHGFRYETENLCRIFFPHEDIVVTDAAPEHGKSGYIVSELVRDADVTVKVNTFADIGEGRQNGFIQGDLPPGIVDKELELCIAECLYRVLTELTGYYPPWGMLTGVRPSKLMRTLINENGEAGAREHFMNALHVSREKTLLAAGIARTQESIIALSGKKSFSLYISIPFCPTRCSYCSFVSHSVESAGKLIPEYVRLLCKEIEIISAIAGELGLRLETIYFGGGTPTSLDADALATVTDKVRECFDIPSVREYTVEAGRPDTVTPEKLYILKNAGVTRISINPQSFDDNVLRNIGRRHTAAQALEAYRLARSMGFDNINMDFIAGLPGDSLEGFLSSLEKAVALDPENITVHTLAMKRSSEIVTDNRQDSVFSGTRDMLDSAAPLLRGARYSPYYMYRQSRSVGNLENTGWSMPSYECLYNIYMMEEIHTVLSAGAGAVTKLIAPPDKYEAFNGRNNKSQNSPYIERIFNFKYPYEYIDRFAEMEERKEGILKFYSQYQ